MTTTDTSEKGLESLIVEALVGTLPENSPPGDGLAESPEPWGGVGFVQGSLRDFDRDHAIDLDKLQDFARKIQPDTFDALELAHDAPKRTQFLRRLQGEIAKREVIDVLGHGVKHGPVHYDVFYGTPTPGNVRAEELFAANIFCQFGSSAVWVGPAEGIFHQQDSSCQAWLRRVRRGIFTAKLTC